MKRRPVRKLSPLIESLECRALLTNSSLVFPGPDGRLVYTPQSEGDQIPDFSMVGYMTGNVPLPDTSGGVTVPVKQTINPGAPGVDMLSTIQNAINAVSALTPDANGFRGAIQLNAGNYPISGTLNINASGVVLIGAGNDPNTGTRLEATGTSQRFLINVAGSGSASTVSNTTHNIQGYVPVGATSFTVDSTSNLSVGQTVMVVRPSTANWIHDIGMDTLTNPWTAGSKNLNSDRVITAINGNTITIDAPLTNSLDPNYGGGTIHAYTWSGRIQKVGIMNMYTYSDYTGSNVPGTPDTDSTHATGVLTMDTVANAWIDNITADNFALNVIEIGNNAKWVTFDNETIQNTSQVQSNIDDAPAGLGSSGQLILVENTTFTNAYHAIALGATFPGPSVYTNITITDPLEGALGLSHSRDETGPHQRWSTGGLFDNVSNTDWINIRNAGNEGSGHGWQGANYVFWNVNARTDISSPPTAQNWVIGGSGSTSEGTAIYDQRGATVFPQSLYATQLWDRMHADPTVATNPAASPNPLSGTTANLSVLGASDAGESGLIYTWTTILKPSGASNPTFSVNGTNAAKNTVATLSVVGTYLFQVTIQDAGGLKTTATVVASNKSVTTISGDQNPLNLNDVIRIVRNGANVDVIRNGTTVLDQDFATAPVLLVSGMSGNDTISIDYSAGNPVPANGLIIDGGSGTDIVTVGGDSAADNVTLSAGSVTINGAPIAYTGAEELDLNLGANSDTLTSTGDTSVSTTAFNLNVTGGGTVSMAAGSTLPTFTDLNVSAATFNLGGASQTIDSLNGTGTITDNGSNATLTVGSQGGSGTFTGVLSNGTGVLSLTKLGAGTLTLNELTPATPTSNAYTGPTTISGGIIASNNADKLAGLSGQVFFNGGTFEVTADTVAANVKNKFTTSFSGGTSSSTGTVQVDAGVTLTIGATGGSACLQTAGGGSTGSFFNKTGAGTLDILSNNGQLDVAFKLNAGTVIAESATALGGADSSANHIDMKSGTTLVLRQDTATNFLTPVDPVDAGGTINVIIDRKTLGPAVTDSVNAINPSAAFTLNLSAGPNIASGVAGLSVGAVPLLGDATLNIAANTALTTTGPVSGNFAITKPGTGTYFLNGSSSYTGATNVNAGTFQSNASIATSSGVAVATNATFIAGVTQTLAALTINTGGTASILPGGGKLLTTSALSIFGTGKLDVTNNGLVLLYSGTSPLNTIRTSIISAYANGAWTGPGITSSTAAALPGAHQPAVGYAEATSTTFMGQPITLPAVIVRYTLPGDANLDGVINTSDFVLLAQSFGAVNSVWNQGDFTYNGNTNALDFNALATNFAQPLSDPPLGSSPADLFGDKTINELAGAGVLN